MKWLKENWHWATLNLVVFAVTTKHLVIRFIIIALTWLSACSSLGSAPSTPTATMLPLPTAEATATSLLPKAIPTDTPPPSTATPTPKAVVITGQATGAPNGCDVQEVAQRLLDFAEAFNQQDPQLGATFFSERAPFAWYSAPGGNQTAIYSPQELATYFESRYARHEQLIFKQIQVNGWEAGRGLVHFQFAVDRQADDLYSGTAREVIGKGAFHCETQSFVVIAIGDQ